MEILGSGMLADAFKKAEILKDITVIAAGVSNSQETNVNEYLREEIFLKNAIKRRPNSKIIYFSTCSVYQDVKTRYIEHKLQMENIITDMASSYCIFRLPQVVGLTTNTTIVSFFIRCLLLETKVRIQKNSLRSLIDVEDVVRIVLLVIKKPYFINSIIDITNNQSITVLELFTKIAKITDRSTAVELIDEGSSYQIPFDKMELILDKEDEIFTNNYYDKLLVNYVPKIIRANE